MQSSLLCNNEQSEAPTSIKRPAQDATAQRRCQHQNRPVTWEAVPHACISGTQERQEDRPGAPTPSAPLRVHAPFQKICQSGNRGVSYSATSTQGHVSLLQPSQSGAPLEASRSSWESRG